MRLWLCNLFLFIEKLIEWGDRMAVSKDTSATCVSCGRVLPKANFFKDKSTAASIDYIPICKVCSNDIALVNGIFSQEGVFEYCRRINKPFVYGVFVNARNKKIAEANKLAEYMRNISVPKMANLTFADGEQITRNEAISELSDTERRESEDLFGEGFTDEEYRSALRLYNKMTNNYPLKTNMHQQILADWAMTKAKEIRAMAAGKVDEAEKWGKRADAKATAAKINPSQLSAADLSEGINSFSKLTEAVERARDIIPILNTYRDRPQDKVDYTIWQFINYCRKLEGKPTVEYREIYAFLDEQYESQKELLKWLRREKDGKYDEVE